MRISSSLVLTPPQLFHLVSAAQAYYYYRHQTDGWPIQLMVCPTFSITHSNNKSCQVGAVLFFDTVHQCLITHTGLSLVFLSCRDFFWRIPFPVYSYVVTNWGNPAYLEKLVWLVFTRFRCQFPTCILIFCIPGLSRSMLVSEFDPCHWKPALPAILNFDQGGNTF